MPAAQRVIEDEELTPEQIAELEADLIAARDEVVARMESHVTDAVNEVAAVPDANDQATTITTRELMLKLADKERKLLNLITYALEKIRTDDYGYCEGTGEAISFKRLKLRPWARYSVAHKERLEKERALHGD